MRLPSLCDRYDSELKEKENLIMEKGDLEIL